MTPIIGVILFVGIVMLAVTVEIGRWATTARTAMAAADAGARSGAAALDTSFAYDGRIVLNPMQAKSRAEASALSHPAPTIVRANARATQDEVCVTVTAEFVAGIGRVFGLDDRIVAVTSCAAPRTG
ncbi:MAG: hypothetical protein KJO84_04890 [Acidimicrobiia bacterium]|nr:hypothetical protein [Acidimicrobiia bacterium]